MKPKTNTITIIENAAKGFVEFYIENLYSSKHKIIGVGTGRTVRKILELMPVDFFRKHVFVASSLDTLYLLRSKGARVLDIASIEYLDFYFDSADYYDDEFNLIKGYGGALFREKILAELAGSFILVVSSDKNVANLVEKPIPLEIVPAALTKVAKQLEAFKIKLVPRTCNEGKRGPIISDDGNIIADIFAERWDKSLVELDRELSSLTGVVATGIFPSNYVKMAIIGKEEGVETRVLHKPTS